MMLAKGIDIFNLKWQVWGLSNCSLVRELKGHLGQVSVSHFLHCFIWKLIFYIAEINLIKEITQNLFCHLGDLRAPSFPLVGNRSPRC